MFTPFVRKAHIRHKGKYPESEITYAAMKGFSLLGIETVAFHEFDEIVLSFDEIVCGYVSDVRAAFNGLNCKELANVDYPKELRDYFGRNVRADKMANVRHAEERVFVKPKKQKQFTGFIKEGNFTDALKTMHVSDDEDVWVSDVLDIVSEYRVFVMYGLPVGMRWYKGDPFIAPDRSVVESAIKAYTVVDNIVRNDVPHACTIDVGVTREGRTIVIEVNDGFAFGTYGLGAISYVRMLDARWRQVVGAPPADKIHVDEKGLVWK